MTSRNSRALKTLSNVGWSVLGIAVFGVGAAFVAGLALDHVDQQWVSCGVHSAKADQGKSGHWVDISSSCGQLRFGVGVRSEAEAVSTARKFSPGSDYEFKLGWTSRVIDTRVPVMPPQARAWRPAS